jgi:flagellar motility protein MotE (MotC chaperone)
MNLRPRLLPAVIIAASALLGVKLADVWLDGGASVAAAWAQTPAAQKPAPAADKSAPAADKPAAPGKAQVADKSDKADKSGAPDPLQMSQEEITLLQQLSDRRTELDKREAGLNDREVLLQAAEKRIDEKIAKLQQLAGTIDGAVKARDDKEEARVQSLAHMYEQMKPAEAARILDQLDIPVILTMLDKMREQKAAPILAGMDPAKAKAVTLALTEKHGSKPPAAPQGNQAADASAQPPKAE